MITGFCCTGRGTHDRVMITAVITHNHGHRMTVTERCPACGLGQKWLGWRVLRQLAGAGLGEIDISALPF